MIHKTFLVATILLVAAIPATLVASPGADSATGALAVSALLLLFAAGVTRPHRDTDRYELSLEEISLLASEDPEEANLSERERMNRLIDHLSLRAVRTCTCVHGCTF